MKEIKSIRFISLFTIALFLICAGDAVFVGDSAFRISRGVNISHWLSQSQRRGQERQTFFTKKDVAYIAGLGYDHIRLPIDEEQMWDESGNKENEAFTLLNNVWANWDYKGGFGIVGQTGQPDEEMIRALIPK